MKRLKAPSEYCEDGKAKDKSADYNILISIIRKTRERLF